MQSLVLVCAFLAAISAIAAADDQVLDFPKLKAVDTFDTYALALQWPPSVCSGKGIRFNCIKPYLGDFTIHGLWPQLPSGNPVPPYTQNPSCTKVTPKQPNEILALLRAPTQQKLRTNWPNLVDYQGKNANEYFWRSEWEKHGMCSDWPDDPNQYFVTGLEVQKNFVSLLSTLQGAGINPNASKTYKVGDISNALITRYGGKGRLAPEIACNEDINGVKQLREIRFCYQRNKQGNKEPKSLISCRNLFSIKCSANTDEVRFPPRPP